MKKLLFFILVLISSQSFAQKENANWCFGINARVDFNSNPPTPKMSAIGFGHPGGSTRGASVSDNNGQLLFYTDGINVWDKNNDPMPNGYDLYGYASGTAPQAVAIVPKPGTNNIYYIFTLGTIYYTTLGGTYTGKGGIHYSVVNMNLNNNKGDIDIANGLKNVPLKNHNGVIMEYPFDYTATNTNPIFISQKSRITTALHADGDKIWVTMIPDYYFNSQHTRYFYSFLVSDAGINGLPDGTPASPYVSTLIDPLNYGTDYPYLAQMKISSNGQFLCDAEESAVLLYNFNNHSGNITYNKNIYNNPLNFSSAPGYGVEFSPDSKLIYFTVNPTGFVQSTQKDILGGTQQKGGTKLYQYNTAKDSLQLIYTYPPPINTQTQDNANILTPLTAEYPFGIQRAIDNKIYTCAYGELQQYFNYLGVIDAPNVEGTGCNFNPTGLQLQLNPVTHQNGDLPQWVYKATPINSSWTKEYEASRNNLYQNGSMIIKKGINDNIYYSFGSTDILNNLNHQGAIPATTSSNFLAQYNSATGYSTWVKAGLANGADYFVLDNGMIRTKLNTAPNQYIYLDGNTGNQVNGPSYVPDNEIMLAETNGGTFITYSNGQIFVHPAIGNTTSVNNSLTTSFFNKNSNRLYIENHSSFHTDALIFVYLLTGNTLVLERVIHTGESDLFHVDNNDNIYTLPLQIFGTVSKYDAATNLLIPISIPGFVNSNIGCLKSYTTISYTSDKALCLGGHNYSGMGSICALDFVNNNTKSVAVSGPLFNSPIFALGYPRCGSFIDNNSIYFYGYVEGRKYLIPPYETVTIGSQTITDISINNPTTWIGTSTYFIKLDLDKDFNRSANNPFVSATKAVEKPTESFTVNLSPNPTHDLLTIGIKEIAGQKGINNSYKISITDKAGMPLIQNFATGTQIKQQVSNLPIGVYFLTITNSIGETKTVSFIKI